MSELTICNYCRLKSIKRDAKAKEKKVKVKSATYKGEMEQFSFQGGFDVFVDGKKVCWMQEITNKCCC